MRSDTRARLTLVASLVLALVPVRAWQRGEIDTATAAVRVVAATAVVWVVVSLVRLVANGYRHDRHGTEEAPPRRRVEDRLEPTEG